MLRRTSSAHRQGGRNRNDNSVIIALKHFLAPVEYAVSSDIVVNGESLPDTILRLPKDRRYRIPYFQSEMRWDSGTLRHLLEDIRRTPKLLGTVVLVSRKNNLLFGSTTASSASPCFL